jgi:hypothetical protein
LIAVLLSEKLAAQKGFVHCVGSSGFALHQRYRYPHSLISQATVMSLRRGFTADAFSVMSIWEKEQSRLVFRVKGSFFIFRNV